MARANRANPWEGLLVELRERGVAVEPGLTDQEARAAEVVHGFRFPPDLRALLQTGLPVGGRFPNWRGEPTAALLEQIAWPLEGMLFDIGQNVFWLDEWGPRPDDPTAAFGVAERAVTGAPRLIPVFGHRYIPAEPHRPGNPVFSVYQTDIIYYGMDLLSYFACEWPGVAQWHTPPADLRTIRFWSALAG